MNLFGESKSSKLVRQALAKRFGVRDVRVDDVKTLMSYLTMHDLKKMDQDEVDAVLREGKRHGLFKMIGSK